MDGRDSLHTIDKYQKEILDQVSRGERRIAVRSGHGVGKTTVIAWILTWWICVKFPQKAVCTAPTSKQLFDALAAETITWMRKLPPALLALLEIKTDEINLKSAPTESFISFRTSRPETPEAMAGIHAPWVLLIADEASGIPEQVFEAAIGSMSGHNATTILAGNPVRTAGMFFNVFRKPEMAHLWAKHHISCIGHPRVGQDFIDFVAAEYGIESNAYRVRVMGEFPKADDDTIIPYELMELALKRDVRPLRVKPVWGLDCARFGSDRSALAVRRGNVLDEPVTIWSQLELMALVGRVKNKWDATSDPDRPTDICVDAIGLGSGVADRLRELGLPARAINVSEAPALGDKYRNLRSELWFKCKEWFMARDCNLANDDALGRELTSVKYGFQSNGKVYAESKDDMKKRGALKGQSPDVADAFVLTFAADAAVAMFGEKKAMSWDKPLKRKLQIV